jgi:hypothetical protein
MTKQSSKRRQLKSKKTVLKKPKKLRKSNTLAPEVKAHNKVSMRSSIGKSALSSVTSSTTSGSSRGLRSMSRA